MGWDTWPDWPERRGPYIYLGHALRLIGEHIYRAEWRGMLAPPHRASFTFTKAQAEAARNGRPRPRYDPELPRQVLEQRRGVQRKFLDLAGDAKIRTAYQRADRSFIEFEPHFWYIDSDNRVFEDFETTISGSYPGTRFDVQIWAHEGDLSRELAIGGEPTTLDLEQPLAKRPTVSPPHQHDAGPGSAATVTRPLTNFERHIVDALSALGPAARAKRPTELCALIGKWLDKNDRPVPRDIGKHLRDLRKAGQL